MIECSLDREAYRARRLGVGMAFPFRAKTRRKIWKV